MKVRLLAVAFSFFLAAGTAIAGPTAPSGDTDGDGVENAFDNCTNVGNTTQADTNHDGCGDSCSVTCDFTGDKTVGSSDFNILRANFGMNVTPGTNGDCDGTGVVGSPDFNLLRAQFGMSTGPSGITTKQCNTASCLCTPQ